MEEQPDRDAPTPKPERTAWRSASIEKNRAAAAMNATAVDNNAPSRTPPSNGHLEGRFAREAPDSSGKPRLFRDRSMGGDTSASEFVDYEAEKARRQHEVDEKERRVQELRQGLHPLYHKYVFWYSRRQGPRNTQSSYEDTIRKISEFSTVEGFWSSYCHLSRPSLLLNSTDYHLFRAGIRPLWEDAANKHGGKWIVRFHKKLSGRFWESLALAIVGEQLDASETVCGVVLSIRFGEDILSIWNREAKDEEANSALRDSIRQHLELPPTYTMEYKPHDASLRDNSSFRNTWMKG